MRDWTGFAEVCGMPLRIGKYEPGASRADREALIHAVRSLGSEKLLMGMGLTGQSNQKTSHK
jgi:phage gp29-like protein